MSKEPSPDLSDPKERERIIRDATLRGRLAMIKPLTIAAVIGYILIVASMISLGSAIARGLSR